MRRVVDQVGDGGNRLLDAVQINAKDMDSHRLKEEFGSQESQFCSLDTFKELWLPHYRRMNDWIVVWRAGSTRDHLIRGAGD